MVLLYILSGMMAYYAIGIFLARILGKDYCEKLTTIEDGCEIAPGSVTFFVLVWPITCLLVVLWAISQIFRAFSWLTNKLANTNPESD